MAEATRTVNEVLDEAFEAARISTQAMLDLHPTTWYPCGFSWVKIRPARGPFVKALKERQVGRRDDYEGGYVVYNPSGNATQWMDAKMAGSRAFAAVLQRHGVKAYAVERID